MRPRGVDNVRNETCNEDEVEPLNTEGETATDARQRSPKDSQETRDTKEEEDLKGKAEVLSAIAMYWCVSISLVFTNKALVQGGLVFDLDAPLFLTWLQFLVTIVGCWFVPTFLSPNCGNWSPKLRNWPAFNINTQKAIQTLPLSFVFVGMMVFNQLTLKHVTIPFYVVARSMAIFVTILFQGAIQGQWASARQWGCILLMTMGYVMGIQGEVEFSFLGTMLGAIDCLFLGLYPSVSKKFIKMFDGNFDVLMLYNNVNAALIFPFIFLTRISDETDQIYPFFANISNEALGRFVVINLAIGSLGFLIGFAVYWQIHVTSPLTHAVSAESKAAAQTILGILVFGSQFTAWGLTGTFLIIASSIAYGIMRHNEK